MTTPANKALIHAKLLAVMNDVGAIAKTKTNKSQGYSFRGIDDVYKCFYPLFVKQGIYCVPKIIENRREERESKAGGTLIYTVLTMEYAFFCEDGSSVTATVIGEGMDSADKSAAKAMSSAHKSLFFQMFVIPVEGVPDADHDSHQVGAKKELKIVERRQDDGVVRRPTVERQPEAKPKVDLGETKVPFGAERVAIKTLPRESLIRKIDWARGKDQYKEFVDLAERFIRDDGLSAAFGEEPVPLEKQGGNGRVYMSRVS
jgi:hypothetical protein